MSLQTSAIPSIKLLAPVVLSILVTTLIISIPYPLYLSLIGIALMIGSYFIPESHEYSLRWLFSAGSMWTLFFITAYQTQTIQESTKLEIESQQTNYIGTIEDFGVEKNKTYAFNIKVKYPIQKRIIGYFEKDDKINLLGPGSTVILHTRLSSFKNFNNPDDFNYAGYMNSKGFSGTAYISSQNWSTTEKKERSIKHWTLQQRRKAINFLKDQQLDKDATSLITALTLGYKEDLSSDLKNAFRASGTSHVLAVSGLHVGIIYTILSFLVSFIGKQSRLYKLRQIVIIILLWLYAIMTGLSPSIIRATIMLTIIIANTFFSGRTYSFNTLFFTAFLILLFSPLSLYDIGFQMSFSAVFAILFFGPTLRKVWTPRFKIGQYIWSLFIISIAAQLGVFPIALFHFGTFPTYFFIANIAIIPLISLTVYTLIPLFFIAPFINKGYLWIQQIQSALQWLIKMITNRTIQITYWIESLPHAQLDNVNINILQALSIILITYYLFIFIKDKKPRQLITLLSLILFTSISFTVTTIRRTPPQLVIFNTPDSCDIALYVKNRRHYFEYPQNGFLPIKNKRILLLSENNFSLVKSNRQLHTDYLIVSNDPTFSIKKLNKLFSPKKIILDNTIPWHIKNKWINDTKALGIACHDIDQDGAFIINL